MGSSPAAAMVTEDLNGSVRMQKKKLIRDARSLPTWFPLPVYSQRLTAEQWLEEISVRALLKFYGDAGMSAGMIKPIFEQGIVRRAPGTAELLNDLPRPSDLLGVHDLPAFDAAYLGLMVANTTKGRAITSKIKRARKNRDERELAAPTSKTLKDAKSGSFVRFVEDESEPCPMAHVLSGVPVIVDVDQDDESLITAFRGWLIHARNELGPARKPVGLKDLADWKEYAVLPVFDLALGGTA